MTLNPRQTGNMQAVVDGAIESARRGKSVLIATFNREEVDRIKAQIPKNLLGQIEFQVMKEEAPKMQEQGMIQDKYHRRLPDFQPIDRITIETRPRFKQSGLSGDEWRQSTEVFGFFKGVLVFSFTCGRDIDTALALLPGKFIEWQDQGYGQKLIERERQCCDQPACMEPWTVEMELKRLTARDGHWLDPDEYEHQKFYRRFCPTHKKRGDCNREDCDENYTIVGGQE